GVAVKLGVAATWQENHSITRRCALILPRKPHTSGPSYFRRGLQGHRDFSSAPASPFVRADRRGVGTAHVGTPSRGKIHF
ncbi:MAG: hypothetical protein ABIQ65_05670, partial [Thermoanaerobaculia bacterium]